MVLPICCAVMRDRMQVQDRVIHQPPKGDGTSLVIL
jgi:hypothetical protein